MAVVSDGALNSTEGLPVEALSDEEVKDIVRKQLSRRRFGEDHNVAILSDAIAKPYFDPEEFEDTRLAIDTATKLGIRTPVIKRVIQIGEDRVLCVQERVTGPTLMEAWTSIGWISTIRLAFQVRSMVRRMRTFRSPTAGSLGTGLCRSYWLENDGYGVPRRAPVSAFTSILNFWASFVPAAGSYATEESKIVEEHRRTCEQGPFYPEQGGLVFTHHDLAPRNLILETTTGRLWIVDWNLAGFYPKAFEGAGMHRFIIPSDWSWFDSFRWTVFAWIAAGARKAERDILNKIEGTVRTMRAARRFNILAGATPALREPPAADDD